MMEKKNLITMIILLILLVSCIALMGVSLIVHDRAFGQVSGYIAIAASAIALIGLIVIAVKRASNKKNDDNDK